jgi:DNA repair protein RadC
LFILPPIGETFPVGVVSSNFNNEEITIMNSYNPNLRISAVRANLLIKLALACLEKRLRNGNESFTHPKDVRDYLRLQLANEPNEVFGVLFLTNANRLLAFEKMFWGTITSSTVHPRVVVQKALKHNAAAVILAHNHPAGICKPSVGDQMITQKLRDILHVIDVSVLDHIIVAGDSCYSFTEQGFL